MIAGHVSIKVVIDKIYRDLGVNTELPFDDMIEWLGEALAFIGAFTQYENVSTKLQVTDYKVKLPCDFYKLAEIGFNNLPLYWSGNSLVSDYFCRDCQIPTIKPTTNNSFSRETFFINDYYIYTSFPLG